MLCECSCKMIHRYWKNEVLGLWTSFNVCSSPYGHFYSFCVISHLTFIVHVVNILTLSFTAYMLWISDAHVLPYYISFTKYMLWISDVSFLPYYITNLFHQSVDQTSWVPLQGWDRSWCRLPSLWWPYPLVCDYFQLIPLCQFLWTKNGWKQF